jgi:hypothetical protein
MSGIILENINQSSFDQLICNTSYGDCFEFGAAAGPAGSAFANWTVRNFGGVLVRYDASAIS